MECIKPMERITIKTSMADIVHDRPGWIEQRWKGHAQFTPEAVMENQAVIDQLANGSPYVLLNVFSAGMRVHLELMNKDHYIDRRGLDPVVAVAVVVDGEEMLAATKLYFMYHQQAFPVTVFEEEQDARAWLAEHHADLPGTGSFGSHGFDA